MGHENAGERGRVASAHRYITGIDGLRAIAVLSVVLYHLNASLLPGGFIGVDLFFVISGFVVSMATSGMKTSGFKDATFTFYRRRFVRILPAALTFILIGQVANVLFVPVVETMTTPDMTAAAATAGLSNIILWFKSGDYFSPGAEFNLFTHTWSLSVEEQFYLIFPALAIGLFARPENRSRKAFAATLLCGLCLCSIVAAAVMTSRLPSFAFYMLPTRFWELGVGVLLFTAIGQEGRVATHAGNGWLTHVASVSGTCLLIASVVLASPKSFPFPTAIAPVLAGAALIYVVATSRKSIVSVLLSAPAVRYFGKISYSLYLWHWPVIVLMRWTVGLDTVAKGVLAFGLSLGFAHISYRVVEQKLRNSGRIARLSDKAVVALGLLAIALSACLVVGLTMVRPHITLSVTRNLAVWRSSYQSPSPSCEVERTKSGSERTGVTYQFTRKNCGGNDDPRRLYVIGDSHAWAYQRLVGNIVRDMGVRGTVEMATGCAILPINDQPPSDRQACATFVAKTLTKAEQAVRPGDVVFLPGLRVSRYHSYWADAVEPPTPVRTYSPADIDAATASLTALLNRGARVIIEAPKPVHTIASFRCSDWFNAVNPHCAIPPALATEEQARRAPAMALIAAVRRREPRIELIDPFAILCPGTVCEPVIDGLPVTTDGDHASGATNDKMTPVIMALLQKRGR